MTPSCRYRLLLGEQFSSSFCGGEGGGGVLMVFLVRRAAFCFYCAGRQITVLLPLTVQFDDCFFAGEHGDIRTKRRRGNLYHSTA